MRFEGYSNSSMERKRHHPDPDLTEDHVPSNRMRGNNQQQKEEDGLHFIVPLEVEGEYPEEEEEEPMEVPEEPVAVKEHAKAENDKYGEDNLASSDDESQLTHRFPP